MDTSIIILNWNGKEDTKKCLISLSASSYRAFEVILVDNGSTDGSVKCLEKFIKEKHFFFNIIFVKNISNAGFTGGNIEGIKSSNGDYVVLLNNDTVVDPEWLESLIYSAQKSKNIGIVGGKTFRWDDDNPAFNKNNISYAYQKIDPYLGYAHTLQNENTSGLIDSISGCAVLIKKEVLSKIGFLDPIFFAYYEETDLFARATRAGYGVYYDSKAFVWHRMAKTAGYCSYFYLYHMYRNRIIFVYKNFDEPFFTYFKEDFLRTVTRVRASYWTSKYRNIDENTKLEIKARYFATKWVLKNIELLETKRLQVIKAGNYNLNLSWSKEETVSIIIPNYNYEKYIECAIASALKQTIKPLEIIVVDDGSHDNSVKKIKKYPVTLIEQRNQGVIMAKNNGFVASKGRFVLFLDADDVLEEAAIEEYLKAYRKNNSSGFFYSDMKYFGTKKGIIKSKDFNAKELREGNYIHNSSLIKREAFEAVGGYHQRMANGYEDWDLYISLIEQGYNGKYVKKVLLNYRQHETAKSRNNIDQEKALDLIYTAYANHKIFFPLWYRTKKKLYYKIYYSKGSRWIIFFMVRLIFKFFTLLKLLLTGNWKEAKKKIRGEMSLWKILIIK